MDVYTFNPLSDLRWHELVVKHPKASVFHQCGWVRALATTYGYEPLVLTTSPSDQPLSNGVVFCRVSSWITGSRLVSLPFSDHCDPLVDENAEGVLIGRSREMGEQQNCKYLEIRPLALLDEKKLGMTQSSTFCFHLLDLRDDLQQIFRRLHKDSIQRKIHRAEREGLVCEVGNSDRLVDEFYHLLIRTRKRHRMLPQPMAWIKNLVAFMGDTLQIRVARQSGTPLAAMLSLRHRNTVVYKYGCSDERKHNLGGVPFLFWNLIRESKAEGAEQLDLGRSDWDQPSLILFKDRLGATKSSLSYFRTKESSKATRVTALASRIPHAGFSIVPDVILSAAGRFAYRHLG